MIISDHARSYPVAGELWESTTDTFLAGPNYRVKCVCLNHLCHFKWKGARSSSLNKPVLLCNQDRLWANTCSVTASCLKGGNLQICERPQNCSVLLCKSCASLQPPLMKDVQKHVVWLNGRANSRGCLGNKCSRFQVTGWAASSPAISVLWFRCIPSWQVRKTHHEFYFNWVYTSLPEITKSLADSDAVEEEDRQTQNVPDQPSLTALHCFICFVVSYLLSPDACTSSEFGAASIVSFSCQLPSKFLKATSVVVWFWSGSCCPCCRNECFSWYATQS